MNFLIIITFVMIVGGIVSAIIEFFTIKTFNTYVDHNMVKISIFINFVHGCSSDRDFDRFIIAVRVLMAIIAIQDKIHMYCQDVEALD